MKKGLFIVVDGIDGSGKSEIVKLLHNHLFSLSKKYRILTTREPTHGVYGRQIRDMLRNEDNPLSSAQKLTRLFVKDREQHLKTIEPFLDGSTQNELNIVLCDRYYYSTIAFQGAQGLDVGKLIEKNRKFRKPDIAFILDVAPEIALERIKSRQKEKFEQLGFMKKIRTYFLKLPELLPDNIKIIDSSKALKEIFDKIKRELRKLI